MEILTEIYWDGEFGIMNLIATILAWIVGIIFILGGKASKDKDDVVMGFSIIAIGSIPFLNGMILGVGGIIVLAALIGAGFSFVFNLLAEKIIGDES